MSDWYNYVIKEFGDSIGVKNLSFSSAEANAINLNVDGLGDVFLERSARGVSLSVAKKISSYPPRISKDELCKNFLERCHFGNKRTELPIQVGIDDSDNFIFMLTLSKENLQVQNLHKGIELLKEISIE